MAGEQPIRPRRFLALELDDCTLSPLTSTRYSSLESSSIAISSATPVTTVVRLILFVGAHLVHHFIDELSPIVVLPPLTVGSSTNQSMEDIDKGIEEGFEGEHNVERKRSSGSDLEVVGVTHGTRLCQGRKRTKAALKGASS
ncbi:hypothetical protein M9H77_30674 [Catharanthus roseus]|uniref:Uncharacterized protein n=1 Tax=Catharanthus roseus TaxID=4058 RepID=A0ACB9ZXY1_CATRO|nr:hypothetical protein M9H77_30674 [Catharanthus roseus]